MLKAVSFVVLLIGVFGVLGDGEDGQGRQKRLLFYDEDGNLVKTYSNPYLQNLKLNPGKLPYYGNLINPFFAFLREFGNSLASIIVPVSNQVIEQIKKNPQYQNTLVVLPRKDPVVEPNPLCEGQRTQIPSPRLCNNYLNCWDGWAVEQECPVGLLFSNQGYCDYSDNVNCGNRKINPQAPTQPQCNKDFDSFRSQHNCNEFFVCVSRQPVKFQCPANLAYSEVLGVCDYPARVDCSSSGLLSGISADPPSLSPSPPSTPAIPNPAPPSANPLPTLPNPVPVPTKPLPTFPNPVPMPTNPLPTFPNPVPVPTKPLPTFPNPVHVPTKPLPTFPNPVPVPSNPASILPPFWPISSHPSRPLSSESDGNPAVKTVFTENSIVNTQSWSSSQVAMSREDAIRQLQRGHSDIDDVLSA